ncbi:MAG: flagellar assembly peptidoglycan hydrolase FlgJ [Gammaproteobacteria bacterium]
MRPAAVTDFAQFATLRAQARSDDPEALRKAAQQFEALMMQQMLKSMRDASLGDDVLGGEQTQLYQEMFDQQIAQHLAAGRGLGIADMLVRQLGQGREMGEGRGETGEGRGERGEGREEAVSASPVSRLPSPVSRPPSADPAAFVQSILPHAEKAARELGIPARVLVAQAALETGWGRHGIHHADGRPTFNFFGIKADKRWEGDSVKHMTHEYDDGEVTQERAAFRAYASPADAFDGYVDFLRANPRYAQALRHGGDAQRFVTGLQQAGYATDPAYARKILDIADGRTMKLALAQAQAATPRTITV